MRITRTARFKKAYKRLSEEEKALARKAISLLAENLHHLGLRVKKLQGTDDIWEERVSRSCRLTLQLEGDTILLRNIGEHDRTLDRP